MAQTLKTVRAYLTFDSGVTDQAMGPGLLHGQAKCDLSRDSKALASLHGNNPRPFQVHYISRF